MWAWGVRHVRVWVTGFPKEVEAGAEGKGQGKKWLVDCGICSQRRLNLEIGGHAFHPSPRRYQPTHAGTPTYTGAVHQPWTDRGGGGCYHWLTPSPCGMGMQAFLKGDGGEVDLVKEKGGGEERLGGETAVRM